jgi:hypothetical protein
VTYEEIPQPQQSGYGFSDNGITIFYTYQQGLQKDPDRKVETSNS